MKIVCSWCNRLMSGDKNDTEISHSICKKCYDKWIKGLK